MSNDASVAPKERVNIVYRPEEGGGREEVELPMKLLVVGDFTGSAGETPLEKREPVPVNKENFDEVIAGQQVSLQISVPNRLTENPDQELLLDLSFAALKDFEPEGVIAQVPQLQRILELREALRALKGPLANLPEFRRKLQEIIGDEEARNRLIAELGAEGEER